MPNEIATEEAVAALNRFLEYDPSAFTAIFNSRYRVKPEAEAAIEADPTLVSGCVDGKARESGMSLGPLGIINGLFGARIAAHYGSGTEILHFSTDPTRPCQHPKCIVWNAALHSDEEEAALVAARPHPIEPPV